MSKDADPPGVLLRGLGRKKNVMYAWLNHTGLERSPEVRY